MTNEPAQQLPFPDWNLPEGEGETALNADEIQKRKDIAQMLLENPETWPKGKDGKPERPFWFDHYLKLLEGMHYPFRAAVLAAWLGTPKSKRWPKTQAELADLLGMTSDRQFVTWRHKNPKIDEAVQSVWRERVMGGLADSVDAMLEVAARPDYKGNRDRELHFKMAEVLKNTLLLGAADVDWSKLTFNEKLRKIREMGVGAENPQLQAALEAAEQAKQRGEALRNVEDEDASAGA